MEEVIMATLPNKELNRLIKIEIAVENLIENGILDEDVFNKDSEYHKQRKKEKKNPIFKRNNLKRKVKK